VGGKDKGRAQLDERSVSIRADMMLGLSRAGTVVLHPIEDPGFPSMTLKRFLLSLVEAIATKRAQALDQLDPTKPLIVEIGGNVEQGIGGEALAAIFLGAAPIGHPWLSACRAMRAAAGELDGEAVQTEAARGGLGAGAGGDLAAFDLRHLAAAGADQELAGVALLGLRAADIGIQ